MEFSAAWCAIVLLCNALSVVLLGGLYRNGRGLRILVLATAFAWSAIVVLVLAFTGPSGGWLYVSRHVGPPLLIALALAAWPARWKDRIESGDRQGQLTALAVPAVLTLGSASIALGITTFPSGLPGIVDPATGHFEPVAYALVLAVNLVCVAVCLYGVARRGDRSRVEVWASVAAVAWLGDVVFVGMVDERFSVAYYASRLLAVIAAMIVPASILFDTWRLHQRLTAGTANLEAQVDRLLEAQRIRDHVSAVVSHDMRAPLAGLHGYLELLVDDEGLDDKLVKRMHERSLMLTRRLTLMCEDLLAATTIEHSDLVITPTDLDLSQQLVECASGFPDLDLRIACPRGVHVYADPLRLQQVLSNLVRNAQVHGAEPITVDISPDPQTVTIRVSDAGEGVPEFFIPRLFDRYSQGARATTVPGSGSPSCTTSCRRSAAPSATT